jgi:hypothetical protein
VGRVRPRSHDRWLGGSFSAHDRYDVASLQRRVVFPALLAEKRLTPDCAGRGAEYVPLSARCYTD